MNTALFDLTYIKNTFGTDPLMINKVLELFLNNTPSLMGTLSNSILNENWGDVSAEAHKGKSSFATLGANSIAKCLSRIEVMAKEISPKNIDLINQEFQIVNETSKELYKELTLKIEKK